MSDPLNEVVQYSSCVVHLTIALENKTNVRGDSLSPTEGDQYVPRAAGSNPTEPLVLQPGVNSTVYNVVPKKCNVTMTGHRQAAKFDMVIDWKNLPLDPRVVKSITAEVHMGLVKPLDFAKGQSTRRNSGGAGALRESRSSILSTRRPDGTAREDTLIIRGIVDEWKTDYTSTYEIHLQGRDLSGVLMDSPVTGADPTTLQRERDRMRAARPSPRPAPASNTATARARRRRLTIFDVLDTRQTITDLVRQIVRLHPRMGDLRVVSDPAEWPNGRIPSPTAGSRLKRRSGASGGGGAASMTFWDLITRYCTLVGAVPKIVGQTLEVRPSNMLFGAESIQRIQDQAIRVVYGRDIQKMDITRKYAGNSKPKIVRCVSTDSQLARGAGSTVEAIWPPRNRREATRMMAKNFDARGGAVEGEVINIPVPGVRDVNTLLTIAQGIYEEIGRNEIRAHVDTGRLTTSTGALGDLLRLRPGRPVELLVDTDRFRNGQALTTTLAQTQGLTLQAAARQLEPYVGSGDIARAMVASHRGIIMEQLRYFFCAEVKLGWTNDKGLSCEFDLQNYWWPRHDSTKALGDQRIGPNSARRRRAQGESSNHANNPGAPAPRPSRIDPNRLPEGAREIPASTTSRAVNPNAGAESTTLTTGRLRGFLSTLAANGS